jgi:hypothetical protein
MCGGKQPYYAKAPLMQMPSINFVSCEGASFRGENFWHASHDGTTQFATHTMPGQQKPSRMTLAARALGLE